MNDSTSNKRTNASNVENEGNIQKLISALAKCVKASNNIPLSNTSTNKPSETDNDSDNNSEYFDEFAYEWSFPEFSSKICESRSLVLQIIGECLHNAHDETIDESAAVNEINVEYDWDNEEAVISSGINLWNESYDCQETMLDRVERYLYYGNQKDGKSIHSNYELESNNLPPFKNNIKGGLNRIIMNTVDMEKPQSTYLFKLDNSRTEIWIPPNHSKSDLPPLEKGHGLIIRSSGTQNISYHNDDELEEDVLVEAPSMYYPHPFQNIIQTFSYTKQQLSLPSQQSTDTNTTLFKPMNIDQTCLFIDNEQQLSQIANIISKYDINLMAVDLEHHSYRSFHGFTCLMQISIRIPEHDETTETNYDKSVIDYKTQTYLIDTIQLRQVIHKHLSSFFHSPKIVKVMHGAKSDVKWLQRDFGIYIVNLFDTSLASRLLKLPSASLAYLLKKYAGLTDIDSWKSKYQLGDWRVRPLDKGMLLYAMGDTHYLLDIYDVLRTELVKKGGGDNADENKHKETHVISIQSVLDSSRAISRIRYTKDPFYPNGYKRLLSNSNRKATNSRRVQSRFTAKQTSLLAYLWDWRDSTARELDESLHYICNDKALMRIAMAMPHNLKLLQGLLNPMPPLVMKYSQQVIDLVKKAKHDNVAKTKKEDSTMPSSSGNATEKETEVELVNNAPHLFHHNLDERDDKEHKQYLEISECNANYNSSTYTNHSMEMCNLKIKDYHEKHPLSTRSLTVDGLGSARVALHDINQQLEQQSSIEMEAKQAQIASRNVRRNLLIIKKWNDDDWLDEKTSAQRMDENKDMENKVNTLTDIENDQIPKSIRETYQNQSKKRRDDDSPQIVNVKKQKKMKTKNDRSNKKKETNDNKPEIIPFDYSTIKSKGIFDTNNQAKDNNPFFAGAALGLASKKIHFQTNPNIEKKDLESAKKGKQNKSKNSPKNQTTTRRDQNRMFVYRP